MESVSLDALGSSNMHVSFVVWFPRITLKFKNLKFPFTSKLEIVDQ
jgi:hypothetical protein